MTDPGTYTALARQCAETAGRIRLLAEAMDTASFHADGLPPDRLREIANTLHGTAMRAAMAADDTDLLNELTGRNWVALHRQGGPKPPPDTSWLQTPEVRAREDR